MHRPKAGASVNNRDVTHRPIFWDQSGGPLRCQILPGSTLAKPPSQRSASRSDSIDQGHHRLDHNIHPSSASTPKWQIVSSQPAQPKKHQNAIQNGSQPNKSSTPKLCNESKQKQSTAPACKMTAGRSMKYFRPTKVARDFSCMLEPYNTDNLV